MAVLREALTRDEVGRLRSRGLKVRKGKVGESVKAFFQNVHLFRDDLLNDRRAPVEHVAIFDEAQRAWNLEKTADFMQRKKKRSGFSQSEPEFLISCMDRHLDWAVIVCLVGGGQEIHTGEAGIDAWIEAVNFYRNEEDGSREGARAQRGQAARSDGRLELWIFDRMELEVCRRGAVAIAGGWSAMADPTVEPMGGRRRWFRHIRYGRSSFGFSAAETPGPNDNVESCLFRLLRLCFGCDMLDWTCGRHEEGERDGQIP
jgi:Uncharacterized conserved protein (DUF2075)